MNLIERVKSIITSPKTEWEVINNEPDTVNNIFMKYILPLAAVGAVASFIGYGLIGTSVLGFEIKGMDWGLKRAITYFAGVVVGYFVTTYVVDALAPSFNSEKNLNKSAQLVAYSYTPSLVGAVLAVLPSLYIIGALFGLYGLYLMYLGIGPMKKTPDDKKIVYIAISIVVLIVAFFVVGLILGAVFGFNSAYRPAL